jgi:hypothetical protein
MSFKIDPDVCIVCLQKFADAGGRADILRHEHHLVPRAFGGQNGPTVMVCTAHHSLLHLIGTRLITNKPYFELMTHDPKQDQKLLWLGAQVQKAHAAFNNDPNKRITVPLLLDGATARKLARLAKSNFDSYRNSYPNA